MAAGRDQGGAVRRRKIVQAPEGVDTLWRLRADVTEPDVIQSILAHLKQRAPPGAEPRRQTPFKGAQNDLFAASTLFITTKYLSELIYRRIVIFVGPFFSFFVPDVKWICRVSRNSGCEFTQFFE